MSQLVEFTWSPRATGTGATAFDIPGGRLLNGAQSPNNPVTVQEGDSSGFSTIPTLTQLGNSSHINQVIGYYNRRAKIANAAFGTSLPIMSYLGASDLRLTAALFTTLFTNIGNLIQTETTGAPALAWPFNTPTIGGCIYGDHLAYLRQALAPVGGLISLGNGSSPTGSSVNGVSWTQQTGIASNWQSACWSPALNIFCAVGGPVAGSVAVMTSGDGATWTGQTASVAKAWSGVCWSPQKAIFCAVSADTSGAQVMTSPDGVTWTSRTASASRVWRSVCWADTLGLFVAVSDAAFTSFPVFMTSPDGTTWTSRNGAGTQGLQWGTVIWAPSIGKLVALAINIDASSFQVQTSTNGTSWTEQTAANGSAVAWYACAWSPDLSLFVAVGSGGTASHQFMTSPDGVTWTSRTAPSSEGWSGVYWSHVLQLFVAVNSSGSTNTYSTSTDGITWSSPGIFAWQLSQCIAGSY
jgi:hypothetical protein